MLAACKFALNQYKKGNDFLKLYILELYNELSVEKSKNWGNCSAQNMPEQFRKIWTKLLNKTLKSFWGFSVFQTLQAKCSIKL